MPTISVCIPTYNRKEYLREALDSILAQTYKDYEIVIVDDGSTDGTEEMIKKLALPITYHWQKNSGDAATRNKLIELAQGRFIAFLDSDDLYCHDSLERLVTAAQAQEDMVVVYGTYTAIDKNGNIRRRRKKTSHSGFITEHLFQEILAHPSGSLLPKQMLKQEGGFDESLPVCSDYDKWLQLSLDYRFIGLSEPTFKRRRHEGNLSSYTTNNRYTEFKVLERFYYEKGGKEAVPSKIAMRRLGKEVYRAGKCALKEGDFDKAKGYLALSFQTSPNIKSLIHWTMAMVLSRLG